MNRPSFVPHDFLGHCKIFPERDVMLLPFQQKWVTDNSRLKLCVKSRQTGLSWTTAYRVVRQKLAKSARLDAWVSSRDKTQALLFIEDANGLQTSLTSQPRTWARTSSTIKDIHCCIDRSGLGRQFAERAAQRFGAYKVEGVDFTTGTKEELAFPVRSSFEDRTIRVPFTNAIRADLRGVRREVTGSGNIRFAGERNRYGHCDHFWALALALHAAKKPASGAITSVKGIHYGKSPLIVPRRTFTPRTLQQRAN